VSSHAHGSLVGEEARLYSLRNVGMVPAGRAIDACWKRKAGEFVEFRDM
jgi:hypothetical protein